MRVSEAPPEWAVHATAVAVRGRALLIFGRSGSGKSRLAADLVRASSEGCPIELVGDDRVILRRSRGGRAVAVRPHPRIAGFIERRGLGLVAIGHRETAMVAAIVRLGENDAADDDHSLQNFPALRPVSLCGSGRRDEVLRWWDTVVSRPAHHTEPAKWAEPFPAVAKEWNW